LSGVRGQKLFAKFMQIKNISKRARLIVVLLGLAVFSGSLIYLFQKSSIHGGSVFVIEDAIALSNQEQTNVGLPVRLEITEIGVDSAVIPVGVTRDGAMDAPKGPDEVAWYNLGPRPGEIGSAVMAGHYGWQNNIPAVFDNLDKIHEGEKIYTQDENGAIITFVVREIRIYGMNDDASDVFFSNDSKAHLNLITCTGSWDDVEKTFSERLIVFADKE